MAIVGRWRLYGNSLLVRSKLATFGSNRCYLKSMYIVNSGQLHESDSAREALMVAWNEVEPGT